MLATDTMPAIQQLHADAFRLLYPQKYYAGFLSRGIRPDGRQLSECRPTTIGLDAMTSADSSALVKAGHTTVVAAIKAEVSICHDALSSTSRRASLINGMHVPAQSAAPDNGAAPDSALVVNVELAACCSPDARPGRPSEAAQCLGMQVSLVEAPCMSARSKA